MAAPTKTAGNPVRTLVILGAVIAALAAWAFIGIALALTFPMWITVNLLGRPDNGVIFASYIGSFLMAGAFLAIGSSISAPPPLSSGRMPRARSAASSFLNSPFRPRTIGASTLMRESCG